MSFHLCFYHNNDLELKGQKIGKGLDNEPEINCNSCRARGYFTKEEVDDYEKFDKE